MQTATARQRARVTSNSFSHDCPGGQIPPVKKDREVLLAQPPRECLHLLLVAPVVAQKYIEIMRHSASLRFERCSELKKEPVVRPEPGGFYAIDRQRQDTEATGTLRMAQSRFSPFPALFLR
jgi:hypothetical protein